MAENPTITEGVPQDILDVLSQRFGREVVNSDEQPTKELITKEK